MARDPGPDVTAAYDELQCYTLAHGYGAFIHQHVVDTWMAQHADEATKPIGLTFALVGLYLHLEQGFSGREVQLAHMALGKEKRPWPSIPLPQERGDVSALDVMTAPPGPERDRAIDAWAASVWTAFHASHAVIAEWLAASKARLTRI